MKKTSVFETAYYFSEKEDMTMDLGVGPGGPGPPFLVYRIFLHYLFNMESRNLLNLTVQNALN